MAFCGKPECVAWCCMDSGRTIHGMFQFFLFLVLTVLPENAWAVQGHGAPEGLYVHQLAHIFYSAALCYLIWDVQRSKFRSMGWRYLQVFCVLMILWNALAFTGHILGAFVHSEDYVAGAGYLNASLQGPLTAVKFWYYFSRLDHPFSVPSLFFLFLGMRAIYRSSCEEEEE